MAKKKSSIETTWNPSGFVQQKYIGDQTSEAVEEGQKQLKKCLKKQGKDGKLLPVLIDITEIGKTDPGSHIAAVSGIKTIPFKRTAVYGSLSTLVLVNTLALVAGKKDKIRAFENRTDALKWLLERRVD